MNTVQVIQEYLGEELTPATAQNLADAPVEHLETLIERLVPFYDDWLEHSESAVGTDPFNYCIDPFPLQTDWRSTLEKYKKFLLYSPRLVVPDPLADVVLPAVTAARTRGSIVINEEFLGECRDALRVLAGLAPAIDADDVLIVPLAFAHDHPSVQEGARLEMDRLGASGLSAEYYGPITDTIKRGRVYPGVAKALLEMGAQVDQGEDPARAIVQRLSEGAHESGIAYMFMEQIKFAGQLCARLNLAPVAANEVVYATLRQEYRHLGGVQPVAKKVHDVMQASVRYRIPGIRKMDIQSVLTLRRNDSAFKVFRDDYSKVVQLVQNAQPADERQFAVEFKQAAEDILAPRIEELDRSTRSSAYDKILTPAALSIAAAACAYHISGSVPVTSVTGAIVAPAGWVLDKLNKQFNASGRKAKILKEVYGMLTEAEP